MTAHRPTAGSSAAAHGMPCLPTTLDELVRAVQARLGLACEPRCDAEAILQRVRDFSIASTFKTSRCLAGPNGTRSRARP